MVPMCGLSSRQPPVFVSQSHAPLPSDTPPPPPPPSSPATSAFSFAGLLMPFLLLPLLLLAQVMCLHACKEARRSTAAVNGATALSSELVGITSGCTAEVSASKPSRLQEEWLAQAGLLRIAPLRLSCLQPVTKHPTDHQSDAGRSRLMYKCEFVLPTCGQPPPDGHKRDGAPSPGASEDGLVRNKHATRCNPPLTQFSHCALVSSSTAAGCSPMPTTGAHPTAAMPGSGAPFGPPKGGPRSVGSSALVVCRAACLGRGWAHTSAAARCWYVTHLTAGGPVSTI